MGMKETFEEKMDAQLEKWEQEINRTKAEAKAKEAEAREQKADARLQQEYHDRIRRMQDAYDDVKAKLGDLRRTGDEKWEGIKADLENTLNNVGDRFKEAGDRIR